MERVRFPPRFADGVRRFNAGEFFEAHEGFEELLDAVEGDDRWKLLIALIQVSVGYHKLFSTHPGAVHMLRLGAEKLAAFPAVAWGVAVERLRARVLQDVTMLEAGDVPERSPEAAPRIELLKVGSAAGLR